MQGPEIHDVPALINRYGIESGTDGVHAARRKVVRRLILSSTEQEILAS